MQSHAQSTRWRVHASLRSKNFGPTCTQITNCRKPSPKIAIRTCKRGSTVAKCAELMVSHNSGAAGSKRMTDTHCASGGTTGTTVSNSSTRTIRSAAARGGRGRTKTCPSSRTPCASSCFTMKRVDESWRSKPSLFAAADPTGGGATRKRRDARSTGTLFLARRVRWQICWMTLSAACERGVSFFQQTTSGPFLQTLTKKMMRRRKRGARRAAMKTRMRSRMIPWRACVLTCRSLGRIKKPRGAGHEETSALTGRKMRTRRTLSKTTTTTTRKRRRAL
mmetsp:Transcript_26919/g.68162  ORF Transcript_26919/g.68162 Transcript_26919/m.68162 type:complete len:278 (+) Transcript_26919:650-1483(+)